MRFIVVTDVLIWPEFWNSDLSVTVGSWTVQKISATCGNKKAKNLEKRKVRSHNKVR